MTRRADKALAVLSGLLLIFLGTFVHSWLSASGAESAREQGRALVGRLGLTDLAIFTEARYTRHWTQADLHTSFQDHPGAFDHFPSGSVLGPPRLLLDSHGHLARKTEEPD